MTFRLGLTRDLLTPSGAPSFGMGALEVLNALRLKWVERVCYVSCNPVTLARDAAVLVGKHGFRLAAAGVLDMFPHTTHVESIALFTRS